jgi:hypothetical protein
MRQDKDLTEEEWFNGEDSGAMIDFLIARARSRRSPLPHRQFRLFACACCRGGWHLLPDEQSRQAVEVSERFADGLARKSELDRACRAAGSVMDARKRAGKGWRAEYLAARNDECHLLPILLPFVALDARGTRLVVEDEKERVLFSQQRGRVACKGAGGPARRRMMRIGVVFC